MPKRHEFFKFPWFPRSKTRVGEGGKGDEMEDLDRRHGSGRVVDLEL